MIYLKVGGKGRQIPKSCLSYLSKCLTMSVFPEITSRPRLWSPGLHILLNRSPGIVQRTLVRSLTLVRETWVKGVRG